MKIMFNRATSFCKRLQHLGLNEGLSFLQAKEVVFLNTISILCVLVIGSYAAINLFTYPLLGCINILTVVGVGAVFFMNRYGRYNLAKNWLFFLLLFFFALTNFIFPNSTDYYLLSLLTVGAMLFRNTYSTLVMALAVLLTVLLPKFWPIETIWIGQIDESRLIVNAIIGVCCMFALIKYLTTISYCYQRQLIAQKDKLAQSNRNMERLFAMLSHDIRSPLIGTKQAVEIMISKELPMERREKMLSNINKQLGFLCNGVDGLLVWSRNNLQEIVAEPEHIDMQQFLSELVDEFCLLGSSKEVVFKSNGCTSVFVYVDRQHLHLILRNLCANALKFSNRQAEVDIDMNSLDEGVEISITDYGLGIPAEKAATLFETIQIPSWGTAGEKGTGLGLSLVKDLLNKNNGKITFSSLPGKTCFKVLLPCSLAG